jgi:hypothetical protein
MDGIPSECLAHAELESRQAQYVVPGKWKQDKADKSSRLAPSCRPRTEVIIDGDLGGRSRCFPFALAIS